MCTSSSYDRYGFNPLLRPILHQFCTAVAASVTCGHDPALALHVQTGRVFERDWRVC